MGPEDDPWKAACIPRRYDWLRRDDAFAACVTLSRALNQLRFARHAIDGIAKDEHRTYASRQEFNTIFVAAATLFEAVDFAKQHIGRYFRNYSEFDALAAVWKDAGNRELLEKHIAPLRNQAVSHFDPTETKRLLGELTITEECVFATGRGSSSRYLHFVLADALAAMTFVGPGLTDTEEEMRSRLTQLANRMAKMSHDFIYAAESLLGAILNSYGFETIPDKGGPSREPSNYS
ncbi:MAG: hypothetical protein WD802_00535 [Gemmatimonadaceae bacterium]